MFSILAQVKVKLPSYAKIQHFVVR